MCDVNASAKAQKAVFTAENINFDWYAVSCRRHRLVIRGYDLKSNSVIFEDRPDLSDQEQIVFHCFDFAGRTDIVTDTTVQSHTAILC